MWFMEVLAMNLMLVAAAAIALVLAAGCEQLGRWGAGWLRGPTSALWAAARGLTLVLVLVVLGSSLLLIIAFLRVQ
jgi:hypothetical protein